MFKLVEGQGLGAQERRRGAARNIVAGEMEDINENRQTEGDDEGTGTITYQRYSKGGRVGAKLTVRRNGSHEAPRRPQELEARQSPW